MCISSRYLILFYLNIKKIIKDWYIFTIEKESNKSFRRSHRLDLAERKQNGGRIMFIGFVLVKVAEVSCPWFCS